MADGPQTPGVPDSFLHYNAAWNERDVGKVRAHLEGSVTDDVHFVDPAENIRGIDALEGHITRSRDQFPDADYVLVSGVDGHNNRYRYLWEARLNDEVTVPGMDVTTIDDQGRIERIDGFFGPFPPLAEG